MIAWGIINELAAEVEKLEAVTVGDCEELIALRGHLERTKIEHLQLLERTTQSLKDETASAQQSAAEELVQVTNRYENQIRSIETKYTEKITQFEQELIHRSAELTSETRKFNDLNTEHLLSVQKS